MNSAASGKKALASLLLAGLCSASVAFPAYGLYYVHSTGNVEGSTAQGAIQITCTVDATAVGEGVRTGLVHVPANSTVEDLLDEAIWSSENQTGLDAIHNYDIESIGAYLADKAWTATVRSAGSQKPGTQTTYDTEGVEGADTVLERFDNVVITIQ